MINNYDKENTFLTKNTVNTFTDMKSFTPIGLCLICNKMNTIEFSFCMQVDPSEDGGNLEDPGLKLEFIYSVHDVIHQLVSYFFCENR